LKQSAWMFINILLATALILVFVPVAQAANTFPDNIELPDGWRPEGIANGRGSSFYVGSLANGAIYKGDLRTGQGEVLFPGEAGRAVTGLYVDQRSNYLFAAGAGTGKAFVFDAETGEELAYYQLATTTPTFVNDVVVTREAAYFTDSSRPVLYRLPLGPGGRLPDPTEVEQISLGGDFVFISGAFNANGIEATPDGKSLLIVHSARGELYLVDKETGDATLVDLGGSSLTNGDGLRFAGGMLYVVRNRLNLVEEVRLTPDLTSGEVIRSITDPGFDVPTTLAAFGSTLYAVNARFTTPPTPETTYTIVGIPRVP
jgi:sugar lactone lactonase YvrE